MNNNDQINSLDQLIDKNTRVFVLTGAGVSTASGLGDYRDKLGLWKRQQPITGQVFCNDTAARQRYWARSAVGWPAFSAAKPNAAHVALSELETAGIVSALVTQNVDQLHQQAGHTKVIDLHGVLGTVSCISCSTQLSRDEYQHQLIKQNQWLTELTADYAPDGDADLETSRVEQVVVPACTVCGDLMKPDVVFFGENVPRDTVDKAMQQLRDADVLLVAGSSLMVYSGFRFCRDAEQRSQPIVILNNGRTRADDMASLLIGGDCGEQLGQLADQYRN